MKKLGSITLYWKLQIIGWLLTSLYWGYNAFLDTQFLWGMAAADLALDVFVGILLTHLYRTFALKNGWQKLDLKSLVPRIAVAVIILSLLYMFLITGKLYINRRLFLEGFADSFTDFFKAMRLQIFITGTTL